MRKFASRAMALGLCVTLGASAFAMTGCKKSEKKGESGSSNALEETGLDKNAEGDISIMLWAGDSNYYQDLGHMDLSKDDLKSQNVAAVYAVAKKFNETYPNIKINLWAKTGDPNQVNTPTWDQEIENFKSSYGKYADIWASTDVVGDIKKGIVADLSVYKDTGVYKSYNKTLMDYLNYYGFQAGLPSYSIPWGVWVNKSLAEENNIEVPDPDWDIDEYTDFATSGDGKTFWGAMSVPTAFIETGTKDINAKIAASDSKSTEFVDLASDAVQDLIEYVPEWASDSINAQAGLGKVPEDIVSESASYEWNYFCNNRILSLDGSPWQLTAAADPNAIGGIGTVQASDWDIYPRPKTDYCDNTVGIVVDPICLHNYAEDDKNSEWSEEEKNKLLITYTFATYWTASTEAKQAIADTMYKSGSTYKSAMNDSFPVVKAGKDYDAQMDIWYSIDAHKRYADKEKMPGFAQVVKIFGTEGATWDYSDKCFPCTITENGETTSCLFEWKNMWNGDIAGSYQTEPDWVSNVKSRLVDWNKTINGRFVTAQEQLKEALKQYYGFTDDQFK
ncbi:MAG: hypothetical protein K6G88_08650 [Lachnospiraceae bacterium]|nr:hypothetical protein [Lachnospiraceae bacterium]